jgi:hypothetical protein
LQDQSTYPVASLASGLIFGITDKNMDWHLVDTQ